MKKYICVLMFLAVMFTFCNTISYAQENDDGRIIYILYDNSSSMVFEEKSKEFHTYWVEADYAMRALAAGRKDNDSIYIYPMNSEHDASFEVKKIEDVDKASKRFFANTPFDSIQKAAQALEQATAQNEKWLLIFTDGMFLDDSGYILKDKLKKQINSINSDINVLYLPFGLDEKVIKFSDDELNNNIQQISGSNSIQQLILDGCNAIYGRTVLEPTSKSEGVQYDIDVPIKELMVFLQVEGQEYLFKNKSEDGSHDNTVLENCTGKLEDFKSSITQKLALSSKRTESFYSYNASTPTNDGKEMREVDFQKDLKTKDIYGKMVQFEKREGEKENQYEFGYNFDLISDKETVALYYNLDLGFEVEITQGGNRLYNWKVPSGSNEKTNSDNLDLEEGDYDITVYPTTLDGERRIDNHAVLLQKVKLQLNDNKAAFGETVAMKAEYGKTISLIVRVSGGGLTEELLLDKKLEVSRRLYPLAVEIDYIPEYFSYNEMEAGEEKISENSRYFSVIIKEDTPEGLMHVRSDLLEKIKLEGTVTHKNTAKWRAAGIDIKIEAGDNGEFKIYPYLCNPDDMSTYEDVVCHLKASFYDGVSGEGVDEQQNNLTGIQDVNLLLKTEPQALEVVINKVPEYTLWDFIKDGVKLEITCGGNTLPNDASIDVISLDGDESGHLLSQSRAKALIHLLNDFFFYEKNEISVQKEFTYLRRGVPCVDIVDDVLNYQPVPLSMRVAVCLLILLVFLWLLADFLFWLFDVGFGRTFHPVLILNTKDGVSDTYKIERKALLGPISHGKRIKLKIKEAILSGNDFPEMYIKKKGRTSFKIVNYKEFQDKDITLNDNKITEHTLVNYEDTIKLVKSNGVEFAIRFIKDTGGEV